MEMPAEKVAELEKLVNDDYNSFEVDNTYAIARILNKYDLNAELQLKIFSISPNLIWSFNNFTKEFCHSIFNIEFYSTKEVYFINSVVSKMIDIKSLEAKEFLSNFFKVYPYSGLILKNHNICRNLDGYFDIKEIIKSFLESKIHINDNFAAKDRFKKIVVNNKTISKLKLPIIKSILFLIEENDLLDYAFLNFPQLIRTNFYGKIAEKEKQIFSNLDFKKEFINKNMEFLKNKNNLKILINKYMTLEEFNSIVSEKTLTKEKIWFKF